MRRQEALIRRTLAIRRRMPLARPLRSLRCEQSMRQCRRPSRKGAAGAEVVQA
jgi:hypothetical protein